MKASQLVQDLEKENSNMQHEIMQLRAMLYRCQLLTGGKYSDVKLSDEDILHIQTAEIYFNNNKQIIFSKV